MLANIHRLQPTAAGAIKPPRLKRRVRPTLGLYPLTRQNDQNHDVGRSALLRLRDAKVLADPGEVVVDFGVPWNA
jgi:hypothetical protein